MQEGHEVQNLARIAESNLHHKTTANKFSRARFWGALKGRTRTARARSAREARVRASQQQHVQGEHSFDASPHLGTARLRPAEHVSNAPTRSEALSARGGSAAKRG